MTVDVAREEEPYDSRFLMSDARRPRFAKEIAKLHRHVPIQWHVCRCQAHRPFGLPRHKGRDHHKKIQSMQVQIVRASFSFYRPRRVSPREERTWILTEGDSAVCYRPTVVLSPSFYGGAG